jgi:amphi-Trp domain-containing protein
MPEEVLFESETPLGRAEIAAYLRTVADNLDRGEDITLTAGGDTVTVSPRTRRRSR